MGVGPAVTSAQTTIERVWPAHAEHKSRTRHARWSTAEGIVCACGDVLGWPDPEHPETYSQYTKRIAAEQVDAASASGRTKGAFGTYSRPTPEPEDGEPARPLPGGDNAPEPGDYPDPEVQEPPRHDDDPGPAEPEDAEVDWGEPPADEPEPEHLPISDAAWEDPAVRQAVRATGVRSMTEVELPDGDEAQAGSWAGSGETIGAVVSPEGDDGAADVLPVPWADVPPPWEGVDDAPEHAVGDQVEVAGTTFTKVSEDPFPPTGDEWPEEGKRAYAEAVVRGNPSNEGIREQPSVGSEVVPYAGVPIMPTQELDPLNGRLAPLDPTLPYTPADVELKIVEILRQLENSELFLRQQLARLHQATHNLDFRYNLALAKSDQRAADQRKAEAWLATEKERHEATAAEMLVRALRDSQHNLRAQLSGFQSVARSLAVSMVNALDGRDKPASRSLLPPEPSPYDR